MNERVFSLSEARGLELTEVKGAYLVDPRGLVFRPESAGYSRWGPLGLQCLSPADLRTRPQATVAMYFGQPVANLREFLLDEAIPGPPIKMGDGEAPVVQEFKYLGSMQEL